MIPFHGGMVRSLLRAGAVAVVAAISLPSAAFAGDLSGGGCCADLEERVAELERTVARQGRRFAVKRERKGAEEGEDAPGEGGKNGKKGESSAEEGGGGEELGGKEETRPGSLYVRGHVHRSLLFWNDGRERNTYGVDNETDGTTFEFEAEYEIGNGWKAGFKIGIDAIIGSSASVNQLNDSGNGGVFSLQDSYFELGHERLGTIRLGQTDPATDKIDNINLAGADTAGDADVKDWNEGFFLRFKGAGLSTLTWGDFIFGTLSADSGNVVTYIAPKVHGFEFSAAWGGDDYWDVALRYAAVWHKVLRVKAGIGYFSNTTEDPGDIEPKEDKGWGGSIAFRHLPTGLNIAFNAATLSHTDRCAAPGAVSGDCRGDDWFYYIRGGVIRDLNALGPTSFYGEFYRNHRAFNESDDDKLRALELNLNEAEELKDSRGTVWGFGVLQYINAAAMEVYVGYRHYDLDVSLIDGGGSVAAKKIENFDAVMAGAKIRF